MLIMSLCQSLTKQRQKWVSVESEVVALPISRCLNLHKEIVRTIRLQDSEDLVSCKLISDHRIIEPRT